MFKLSSTTLDQQLIHINLSINKSIEFFEEFIVRTAC